MKINHGSPVRVSHRKKKRDIIYRSKSRATAVDYMWRVGGMLDHYKDKHDINNPKVFFLLFIYSMESFLIKGVAKEYGRHWRYIWEKVFTTACRRITFFRMTHSTRTDPGIRTPPRDDGVYPRRVGMLLQICTDS